MDIVLKLLQKLQNIKKDNVKPGGWIYPRNHNWFLPFSWNMFFHHFYQIRITRYQAFSQLSNQQHTPCQSICKTYDTFVSYILISTRKLQQPSKKTPVDLICFLLSTYKIDLEKGEKDEGERDHHTIFVVVRWRASR